MVTFASTLLNSYASSGLAWVQTVGCILVIYGYLLSTRKTLWNILLAHAITGLVGIFIENTFIAQQSCCAPINNAILLGLNEINWIIHEGSTVMYSLIKLEAVIYHDTLRKAIRVSMIALGLAFAALRINIGRLRVLEARVMTPSIERAHSYAFIIWGIADVVLFVLLAYNTVSHLTSNKYLDQSKSISGTLLKSSIPRFFVLIANTFAIVVIGQISKPSAAVVDLNTFVWLVKGTYPLLLLFDIQTTKSMLIQAATKGSQPQSTQQNMSFSYGSSAQMMSSSSFKA